MQTCGMACGASPLTMCCEFGRRYTKEKVGFKRYFQMSKERDICHFHPLPSVSNTHTCHTHMSKTTVCTYFVSRTLLLSFIILICLMLPSYFPARFPISPKVSHYLSTYIQCCCLFIQQVYLFVQHMLSSQPLPQRYSSRQGLTQR